MEKLYYQHCSILCKWHAIFRLTYGKYEELYNKCIEQSEITVEDRKCVYPGWLMYITDSVVG